MYQTILYSMSLMMSMIFTQTNHPLTMGLVLLLQTLLITMITGMTMQSFWFSYILFLIFLGGLLVLFIYVTTLASNEKFYMSMKMLLMLVLMMIPIMYMSYTAMLWFNTPSTLETMNMNTSLMSKENITPLIKMYNNPTSLITVMLILYLFLTLIAIVKITNIFHGPLRQKN